MKKFAVILAGCGVYDGAEIHEATLTLLAIKKSGAEYGIFAPDIEQHHVVNHLTGQEMPEKRNVLVESARIARGAIKPLEHFRAEDFDAIILPGGFGVAKNLCTWAFEGDNCRIDASVELALKAMHAAGKPIGALCISPVIIGKLFPGSRITTGNDPASSGFIEKMGSVYAKAGHGEVITDRKNKIFTTPCYMLDANIVQIAEGAENIVKAIMEVIP